jgi:hypothetical protein
MAVLAVVVVVMQGHKVRRQSHMRDRDLPAEQELFQHQTTQAQVVAVLVV